MGHYTTLARFANMTPRASRGARSSHGAQRRADGETADSTTTHEYTHVCPECGDGATVSATCPRCDVKMRCSATSAAFPTLATEVYDQTRRSSGAAAFGLGVVFGAPALAFFIGSIMDRAWGVVYAAHSSVVVASVAVASLALLALAPLVLADRLPNLRRKLLWNRILRDAEARLRAIPSTALANTPPQADEPIRVRGVVRILEGEVHVTDGHARVRVPVDPCVRVIDGSEEAHYLEDGQEVEVVGVGAREIGGGEAYRESLGEFIFDASRNVEVWIR